MATDNQTSFRTNCTPEEWAAYQRGYLDGYWAHMHDQRENIEGLHTLNRARAFGAIRRAAAVARHHDYEARIVECASTDLAKRLAAEHFCLGRAVRRAIRDAIGSAKT